MDGGHETLNNTKLVVDHLGQGSKAVGGARGVTVYTDNGASECIHNIVYVMIPNDIIHVSNTLEFSVTTTLTITPKKDLV